MKHLRHQCETLQFLLKAKGEKLTCHDCLLRFFLFLIVRSFASQRKSPNNVSCIILALSPLYKKSLGIEKKNKKIMFSVIVSDALKS